MPYSEPPPEQRAEVTPFDPSVLERAIIALPLLKRMEEDLKLIDWVRERRSELLSTYNAAIRYKGQIGIEQIEKAYEDVKDSARLAGKKALNAFYNRILRFTVEQRSEEDLRIERGRYQALEVAVSPDVQVIRSPEKIGDHYYSFARLHAAVIRRMISEKTARDDENRQNRGEPSPIDRILPERFDVIIDLNLEHPGGREAARRWVYENLPVAKEAIGVQDAGQEVYLEKSRHSKQYVFARMEARVIRKLVEMDIEQAKKAAAEARSSSSNVRNSAARSGAPAHRAIFHIWPDFPVSACINRSTATVKADAAQIAFSARGAGITWAVMDSGVDQSHEHFTKHSNLAVSPGWHRDFTPEGSDPLRDENGHGTHVAGIIGGEWQMPPGMPADERPVAISRYRKANSDDVEYQETPIDRISGIAPECKLVSLKVLDENGKGSASSLIAAIAHIQEINGYGRRLLIEGVNMSLGYTFEPEWFACGQSPLCVEVDRLVKSGVVVVVAAGNTGYGVLRTEALGSQAAGMALTINDPGNADLAITVGSTHRDQPHVYGVSYFSSKGPTGDGRLKPDLVAPGERIISCAAPGSQLVERGTPAGQKSPHYIENSGTSMAAPHVSGAIAAFLSIRGEFRGQPEKVKQIFLSTATDLKRDRYFQGAGLVDLMRAIQSV